MASPPRSARSPTRRRPRRQSRSWSEIDARLYELKPKIAKLEGDARKTLASLVTGMLPKVQSAIDRVQATPGASEVIKPTLDPIMAKLDDWSHQPA